MDAPVVSLTIAGSDCCAGAGIQADLKTFSLLGIHGLTAISTVVAQTPSQLYHHQEVSALILKEQIEVLLAHYPVAAIKTGLLGSATQIAIVADILGETDLPVIVDPVLGASSGTDFGSQEVIQAYMERLLPLAHVATPNLPEALRLLGKTDRPESEPTSPVTIARELTERLSIPILLTGGHSMSANHATDILCTIEDTREYSHARIDLQSAHGTGCTYSSAIAGFLALGHELREAIPKAQLLMRHVLTTSYQWPDPENGKEIRALNQLPMATIDHSQSKKLQ